MKPKLRSLQQFASFFVAASHRDTQGFCRAGRITTDECIGTAGRHPDIPDDLPVSKHGLFPIVAVTGALLLSGLCAAWIRGTKPATAAVPAIEGAAAANATPVSLTPNANPAVVTATSSDEPRNAPSRNGGVTLVAANQPNGNESSPRPRISNQESVLGEKDAVDQLDVPASLPKGMLAFLRGLDSLNAFQLERAIDAFSEAIESGE